MSSALVMSPISFWRWWRWAAAGRNWCWPRATHKALLARGAFEIGAAHYPLIVFLHTAWLASILWFLPHPTTDHRNGRLLAVFIVLQGLRVWVLATLGPYWTTRIIALPGAPLVTGGPYRFVRHPNYLVVAGEILVLPLVFGESHGSPSCLLYRQCGDPGLAHPAGRDRTCFTKECVMLRYCGPFLFLFAIPLFYYGLGAAGPFASVALCWRIAGGGIFHAAPDPPGMMMAMAKGLSL